MKNKKRFPMQIKNLLVLLLITVFIYALVSSLVKYFPDIYSTIQRTIGGVVPTAIPGSIWTTKNDCGDLSQDVNQYAVGEHVYINGKNFNADTYDWEIRGQPGSCDSKTVVASGSQVVGSSGTFCFDAYTVESGDCGEYKVNFGGKNDNYRVKEATTTTTAEQSITSTTSSTTTTGETTTTTEEATTTTTQTTTTTSSTTTSSSTATSSSTTTSSTTTIPPKESFQVTDVSLDSVHDNVTLSYNNSLNELANVLFTITDRYDLVVKYIFTTANQGIGSVKININCTQLVSGNHAIYWYAFKQSDSELQNILTWSKSNERKIITCE